MSTPNSLDQNGRLLCLFGTDAAVAKVHIGRFLLLITKALKRWWHLITIKFTEQLAYRWAALFRMVFNLSALKCSLSSSSDDTVQELFSSGGVIWTTLATNGLCCCCCCCCSSNWCCCLFNWFCCSTLARIVLAKFWFDFRDWFKIGDFSMCFFDDVVAVTNWRLTFGEPPLFKSKRFIVK